MNSAESAKLDREIEAFTKMRKALEAVDESDRPRIIAAVAVLYGIEEIPTSSLVSRPR